MPQISKCRIVNFWYNDGTRLIADELYNFSNMDSTKASNVLIDMENGIGKTVLLQLMLQPVLPKAKISGRRMEDFFTRGSYHSYVLLEWFKDNSTEKLLTGISMASSDSMSQDDESEGRGIRSRNDDSRGRGIKYYTFYINYSDYDKFSIENMELSHKEKGRFVPVPFDYVRSLARKNKNRITCFSSDESSGWKNLLLEYGIVQAEWNNIMVALNQKEGGISSYFDQYRKSDRLVDELLIPTVEGRFSKRQSSDTDDSLETMLITYARRYSQKKDFLEEREISQKLTGQLQEFRDLVSDLWNIKDQFDKSKGIYFAFYGQLAEEQKKLESSILELKEEKEKKEEEILHIQAEQASANYYLAEENLKDVNSALEKTDAEIEMVQAAIDEAEYLVKIMDCARIFAEIRKKNAELQAIRKSLEFAREESAQNEVLNLLRYSVRTKLRELLPEQKRKTQEKQEKIEQALQKQHDLQESKKQAHRDLQKADFQCSRQQGILEVCQKQTDSLVEKLQLPVIRLFFGGYQQSELEEQKKKKQEEVENNRKLKEKAETRQSDLNAEIEKIPEHKELLLIAKTRLEGDLARMQEELRDYLAREKEIFSVCDRYNMEHPSSFSGSLSDYLKNQRISVESQIKDRSIELEMVRRQSQAAARGILHVPGEIESYLEEQGIEYQPCEKYLLSLVETGHMTEEESLCLLNHIPALAYGILVSDRNTFLKNCKNDKNSWLPASAPVFTYQELTEILNGKVFAEHDLALYSEKYFADHENYLENLKKKEAELAGELEALFAGKDQFEQDSRLAEAFTFEQNWKSLKEEEIRKLEEKVQAEAQKIKELEKHQHELENLLKQLKAEIADYEGKIRLLEGWLERFDQLQEAIRKESESARSLEETKKRVREMEIALKKTEELLRQTVDLLEKLQEEKNQLDEDLQKMQEAKEAVSDLAQESSLESEADAPEKKFSDSQDALVQLSAPENLPEEDSVVSKKPEIPEGSWLELYEEYRHLMKTLGEEEEKLLAQLDGLQKEIDSNQKELKAQSKGVTRQDYESEIYSASRKQKAQERGQEKNEELKQLNIEKNRLSNRQGKAQEAMRSARETLHRLGRTLLSKEEVGADFEKRISFTKEEKNQTNQILQRESERSHSIEREQERVQDRLMHETKPETIPELTICIDDVRRQNKELYNDFSAAKERLKKEDSLMQKQLRILADEYEETYSHIQEFFRNLKQAADNDGAGDHYYTMIEMLEGAISSLDRRIHQITGDLEDFDKSKEDLLRQCLLQARKILNGLNKIQYHSRIQVYEGYKNIQMIRMPGLPREVDESVARLSIENEIDKGTQELAGRMQEDGVMENDLRKSANHIVGSKQLLRKYIQKDHIRLDAYKVDNNPNNAQYRSWEETQTENSGAQKFLVYFSIIVAIIAFNRSESGFGNEKGQTSVLILDNPFGPITSAYALRPMFSLAHKLNVQMICLSNITLCDITICFENVIKAVLRRQSLSNVEMVTHESNQNEVLSHGFYKSQQLTLEDLFTN